MDANGWFSLRDFQPLRAFLRLHPSAFFGHGQLSPDDGEENHCYCEGEDDAYAEPLRESPAKEWPCDTASVQPRILNSYCLPPLPFRCNVRDQSRNRCADYVNERGYVKEGDKQRVPEEEEGDKEHNLR